MGEDMSRLIDGLEACDCIAYRDQLGLYDAR